MNTINSLNKLKAQGEKIAMLTAYDAGFARTAEQAGMDALLVGDSLGMVVQGQSTTLPVSVDDMVYHTACVSRATEKPFIISDMPYLSYTDNATALVTAGRLIQQGGAHMVKLEGAGDVIGIVKCLTSHAVPVCAHLGLLPQSVHRLGGYPLQGQDKHAAAQILYDAETLEEAGAQLLVLECVPAELAREISANLEIPVIGIGAGVHVDGQVLVMHDMLGVSAGIRRPRFVKDFLSGTGSIEAAMRAYVTAVKAAEFPAAEHSFT